MFDEYFQLESRLKEYLIRFAQKYFKITRTIVKTYIEDFEEQEVLGLFERANNEILESADDELQQVLGEVMIQKYNILPNSKKRSQNPTLTVSYRKEKITFNKTQTYYIKIIFEENGFIDKQKFLAHCSKHLLEHGKQSLSRKLRYYYERKVKGKNLSKF